MLTEMRKSGQALVRWMKTKEGKLATKRCINNGSRKRKNVKRSLAEYSKVGDKVTYKKSNHNKKELLSSRNEETDDIDDDENENKNKNKNRKSNPKQESSDNDENKSPMDEVDDDDDAFVTMDDVEMDQGEEDLEILEDNDPLDVEHCGKNACGCMIMSIQNAFRADNFDCCALRAELDGDFQNE